MAGKLAPSLGRLFKEIDARWPNRDRRTDGWYASPTVRKSKGHNPGHNGYSHAIDVDDDGISEDWIINHIYKSGGVLWYIIWNRWLYSNTYHWIPQPYHGKNPHTDHMHIEIYQTTTAEQFGGWWGIRPTKDPGEQPGGGGAPGGSPAPYNGDFGPNYGGRDFGPSVIAASSELARAGSLYAGQAAQLRALRR